MFFLHLKTYTHTKTAAQKSIRRKKKMLHDTQKKVETVRNEMHLKKKTKTKST